MLSQNLKIRIGKLQASLFLLCRFLDDSYPQSLRGPETVKNLVDTQVSL